MVWAGAACTYLHKPAFLSNWLIGRNRVLTCSFEQKVEEKVQERVGSLTWLLAGLRPSPGETEDVSAWPWGSLYKAAHPLAGGLLQNGQVPETEGTVSSNLLRNVVPLLSTRSVPLGPAPMQAEGITELHTWGGGSVTRPSWAAGCTRSDGI